MPEYRPLHVDDDLVIYDQDDTDSWLQSDTTVADLGVPCE